MFCQIRILDVLRLIKFQFYGLLSRMNISFEKISFLEQYI